MAAIRRSKSHTNDHRSFAGIRWALLAGFAFWVAVWFAIGQWT
jgi:hypothetical protein